MAVIVNIPNAHDDNSQWNASGGYWDINVRTNDGYVFVGDIKAVYNNKSGYPKSVVLEQNGAKVWAFGKLSDTTEKTKITITGNTQSGNDLEVINKVPNTTARGEKSGRGAASVTLTANEGFKITSAKVAFSNGYGYPASEDMTISEGGKSATWQNDDCQPDKGVTISGKTVSDIPVVNIKTNFSSCYADPPVPEFSQVGETLNVTIKANENTAFDTEQSTPNFSYYNEKGYPTKQDLTVSEDKRTATGSIVIQDGWHDISVNAQAYPVAVVGEQYGAINVYLVTLDELAEFSGKRFFKETGTDPSTGATIYENIDLGAYVNKIRRVYTNIGASSTDVIRCGNYNTGVSCHQPAQDKIPFLINPVQPLLYIRLQFASRQGKVTLPFDFFRQHDASVFGFVFDFIFRFIFKFVFKKY